MGSWDICCSLSGLHIGCGDAAVLIPLKTKQDLYDNEYESLRKVGRPSYCSNNAYQVLFEEPFFPIKGIYDDYGTISDLEKNEHTRLLEEYYGLTLEQIVAVLTDGRKDIALKDEYSSANQILDKNNPRHMQLISYSITWIHGDLYEKLAAIKDGNIYCGNHNLLLDLGFTYQGIDSNRQRYNKLYTKGNYSIYSDGTWLHSDDNESLYNPESFKAHVNKSKEDIDITQLQNSSSYEQIWKYGLSDKETRLEFELLHMFGLESSTVVSEHMIQSLQNDIDTGKDDGFSARWLQEIKNKEINSTLLKAAKNGADLQSVVCDWNTVRSYYFILGRYLQPIGTAPQCGEPEQIKTVLELALEIVNKEILERGEYEY